MTLAKVRRTGHSLSVTIPTAQACAAKIAEGMYVEVEADETSGVISTRPVEMRPRVRGEVLAAAERITGRERSLYRRLAKHEPSTGEIAEGADRRSDGQA